MEIDYTICNKKKMKNDKCIKCTFESKNRKCFPMCKITKDTCQPVQIFINKFLHKVSYK
jgi:phage antirepressor YoqD-like protein